NGSPTPGCVQDNDTSMSGWQGTITVHVTGDGQPITGSNVTFTYTIGAGAPVMLGTGPVALDSSGNASLTMVPLPEGTVTLTATTDHVADRGVGSGTATVTVDTAPPSAPSTLTATIADRRKTSVQLTWPAPSDNGARVAGYDVRYAKTQITNDTQFNAATAVTYTGQPQLPTVSDGVLVDNLYIENGYFFAVKARDAGGNLSPLIGTTTAVTAHFNVTTLNGVGGASEQYGFQFDPGDVNKNSATVGPSYSDLIVGSFTGKHACLSLGGGGSAPSTPSVTFTGDATTTASFGRGVGIIGDVDNDGFVDL